MATIDDLRAALLAQAEDAPAVEDILAAVRADVRADVRAGHPSPGTGHDTHGPGHRAHGLGNLKEGAGPASPAWRRPAVLAVAAATVAAAIAVPTLVASSHYGDPRLAGQEAPLATSATSPAVSRPATSSSVGARSGAPKPRSSSTPSAPRNTPAPSTGPVTSPAVTRPPTAPARTTATTPSARSTSGTAPPPEPPAVRGPDGPDVATTLTYSFKVAAVDGYDVAYAGVLPTAQYAEVASNNGGPAGSVTVYAAGAFDPQLAQQGEPAKIGDIDGYYAELPNQQAGASTGETQTALAWPYGPDAWAVVQGDWSELAQQGTWTGDPEAAELAVAEAVDTGTQAPLLVPMKVTSVPPGTVPESVQTGTSPYAVIGLSDGGPSDAGNPDVPGHGAALEISADPFDPAADLRQVDGNGDLQVPGGDDIHLGTPVTVSGARAFQAADGDITAVFPDRAMTVRFTGYGPNRYSASQMLDIAQGLVLSASPTDQDTWFDASTAVQ